MPNTNPSSMNVPQSYLLSEISLKGDTLIFGLDFRPTLVTKSGLINRLKNNQQAMDIDITCLTYDKNCQLIDTVWFKQLRDSTQAIRHHGDSLNGKDRGEIAQLDRHVDLEQIEIRLKKLDPKVQHIALVVSSYYGQPLTIINKGDVTLTDDEGTLALTLDLTTLPEQCKALWVSELSRELGEWRLTNQKLPLNSHHISDIRQQIAKELARANTPA